MPQDPYQTLGISPTASLVDARTAYLKRVRVLHPDRFDPVSQKSEWELANQMLRDLNAAWEAVENRRASYPNGGAVPPPIPPPTPQPQQQRPHVVSPKPRWRASSASAQRNMAIICVLVVITTYIAFLVHGGYKLATPIQVEQAVAPTVTTPATVPTSSAADAAASMVGKPLQIPPPVFPPVTLTVTPPVDLVKDSEFSNATNARLDGVVQKANLGDKDAERELGCDYLFGTGVLKDYALALAWFNKASAQGDAVSQIYIADMYMNGWGVPKDYRQALEWSKKATDQGNAVAEDNVGLIYEKGGWGVDQDYTQALNWYQKSADQGDADAQFEIGRMYDNGNGVDQDYKRALYWYLKASNQGNAQASYYLGFMYEAGNGVPLDQTQAFFWWKKAAEKGDATSQSLIGEMYERGEGVAKDQALAAEWYRKAAAQGIAGAKEALDRLANAQQPPAPVHSYADSSGKMYSVSDTDYQRLFPIKSALDAESQNLDRLEAKEATTGDRIRQDRENLDNTDSVALDNFNAEVDAYNSSQAYIKNQTDAFNSRVDDFNRELHRVGTLINTEPSTTVSPTK